MKLDALTKAHDGLRAAFEVLTIKLAEKEDGTDSLDLSRDIIFSEISAMEEKTKADSAVNAGLREIMQYYVSGARDAMVIAAKAKLQVANTAQRAAAEKLASATATAMGEDGVWYFSNGTRYNMAPIIQGRGAVVKAVGEYAQAVANEDLADMMLIV